MTEGEEEAEAMHVHEDYQNDPYQPPTPTPNQQQQIEKDLALMTLKVVYPYKSMDSFEWFQELQLATKDAFYRSVIEEDISEIDYTHAQRVFNHFNMTDLGDYHNFYVLTDVLLLADMFKNFRDMFLQHYGLDPAHNYISPALSWQATLKMTDVELDHPIDIGQHLFIEEGIKGGVAISHQYVRGNAPGMKNSNFSKCDSYIMYVDGNSLYGWEMSQTLSTSNFKWLKDEEMEELDMMMIPDDSPRGYILECDLGKHYLYYLYIHVYFIKCSVSFLYISECPRDFTKFNVSFLCISEYLHELHDLHKQSSTNRAHSNKHPCNVHVKSFSRARHYVHINQSKHF